ncbi:RDD family protein [Candidatus Tisiphia endosymbiont of Dascillus cervinus]|uniref:RDD family protein n=1 Tax=Candidatus Tisiphia endosymbiont of Dascillus cervinus TaxID=3066253 RepID=UPI00312CB947
MNKQIIYPKLIPRLFASCLDSFLLSIFTTSITHFMLSRLSLFFFKASIADILIMGSTKPELVQNVTASNVLTLFILMFIINFALAATYFIGFWIYLGATPGKMVMHMKIVDAITFGKPSKWQLIKRFCGYVLVLVGIWFILFSKQRQALYDKIAGTVVIKS